jgi:hypothetical protein
VRPTMYLSFSLLFAVVMTVPACPAVPTSAVAAESSVSLRPVEAEAQVKLALYKKAYCSEYIDDCGFDNDNDDDGLQG